MNASLMFIEILVLLLGLGIILLDLWTAPERKKYLGYGAAAGLAIILIYSLSIPGGEPRYAFGQSYVLDGLALFFKRFFLLAGIIVLIMAVDFAEHLETGIAEFYGLVVLALCGMLFAASANDFTMLFVSVELITVTFYILTSFQRSRLRSLEAGIKYLILGALASGFIVYGIALIYGVSGTMSFSVLAQTASQWSNKPLFMVGILLVVVGLGFKIAAFPFQIWAPDVYQGAPSPTTAFLAVGSKAAGFVVLLRVLFSALPQVTVGWTNLLLVVSGITILYGNLCALPQRNLKRLLGYSSIAHAGYLLLGVAAMAADVRNPTAGGAAILFYLSGYLFTVLAAFAVLCLVLGKVESDDITSLAGLRRRAPLLATTMTLAMISLAGVPPLAGFFGKFLLLQAALVQGAHHRGFYALIAIAVIGVVISLYYYLGVIRAIYWSGNAEENAPIAISLPLRVTLYGCVGAMLYLGVFPGAVLQWATTAANALKL